MDCSIRVAAIDDKQRQAIAQDISRAPLALRKIHFQDIGGKIAFHTDYNQYLRPARKPRSDKEKI
jgi:hypothetical protein